MKSLRHLIVPAACAIAIGAAPLAIASDIPYPNTGTENPVKYTFTATTTGPITAYFAGSGASFDEQLGMLDNGVLTSAGYGLDNHTSSLGEAFDLGTVTAGDVLTFVVRITASDFTYPVPGYVYSDPTLNAPWDDERIAGDSSHNHVYSTAYESSSNLLDASIPTGTYVGFEDLPAGEADYNYFDETFVFTNVSTSTSVSPEPASGVLLGTGLALATQLRHFKTKHRS